MGESTFKPRHQRSVGRTFTNRQAIDNLYDHKWEKYRLRYLHENPRCYSCGEKATVVDHVVPHKGSEKLFLQLDNHLPLCARCHNTVTALFDRHYKPGSSISKKAQFLKNMREKAGITFKVKILPSYE